MKGFKTTQGVLEILALLENTEEKHVGLSPIQSQISFNTSFTLSHSSCQSTGSNCGLFCWLPFNCSQRWMSEYWYRFWVAPSWVSGCEEPPVTTAYRSLPFARLDPHLPQENLTALFPDVPATAPLLLLRTPGSHRGSPAGTRAQRQRFGLGTLHFRGLPSNAVARGAPSFAPAPVNSMSGQRFCPWGCY